MTKFLFTVDELIDAGCFTLGEYLNTYNETEDVKSKPWKIYENLAQKKGVTSSSFFEKADIYFNDKIENQ